jgi:hypothetical protein
MIVALIGLAACGDSKAPTLTGNNTITYTIGDVVPRLDTLYSSSDDTHGDLTCMDVIDSEDVDFTKPEKTSMFVRSDPELSVTYVDSPNT